jgi:hypothetical protein
MSRPTIDPRFDASRRRALTVLLATATAGLVGCPPLRIGLQAYPDEFKSDAAGIREATLEAFVLVVVPGASCAAATVRLMLDPWYGFAPYAGYFASELHRLAMRHHGQSFAGLRPAEQHAIVAEGLEAGGLTARLYTGAVFLAQVTTLAGVHDDATGSPLLQFPGAKDTPEAEPRQCADTVAFRVLALTHDGNPD